MNIEWVVGIALAIISGLIGIIYYAGQLRDDKQDERFDRNEKEVDEHVKEDVRAHERIRAVEIKIENVEDENRRLAKNIHDLRSSLPGIIKEYAEMWVTKLRGK